jgi:leukotriene-A4 hydrolase
MGVGRLKSLLVLLAIPLFVAAKERAVRLLPAPSPPQDVFSFSEPSKVLVRHLTLDLTLDFDKRQAGGTATLEILNLTGTRALILDTRGLDIRSITRDGRTPAPFTLGIPTNNGAPLTIEIEPDTHSVTIDYTAGQALALVWRAARETAGGKQPLVYSTNEPTLARTWIPIQDTPAVRVTYDATLRVPGGLLAVMTSENNPVTANDAGIYMFHMGSSIPAYLIALAAGRLEFRPFDARTGVYAEPELIDNASTTLRYVPDVMAAGEALCGSYPWRRYDILLLPRFGGGMENPGINFIDSTVTGDVAPSTLISHELSHSWAGDMVTLAAWSDVWLNEGLASYLQYRLVEPFLGKEAVDNLWAARRDSYLSYAKSAPSRSTLLHNPLSASDNAIGLFGLTQYIKGALFFHTVEQIAGRDAVDRFLRDYFSRFAWRYVDDVAFLKFLRQSVVAGNPELEQRLQLDEWVYQPGLPGNVSAAGDRHSFHVAAPQMIANSSAADAVPIVAGTAPNRSAATPATMLDTLMVSVTNP